MKLLPAILIINGPNLNLLGKREPSIYGDISFETYIEKLREKNKTLLRIDYMQSNAEGELIDALHRAQHENTYIGIALNAGAYTHTSIAIRDAIGAISTPVVEVHISNIFARESFRHTSYLSAKCVGIIGGFGMHSYQLAIDALMEREDKKSSA